MIPTKIFSRAKGLTSEVGKWVGQRFPPCPPEELEARLATCKGCEFWDQAGFAGTGSCKKCGCSTQAKLRMGTSKCPIDKW